MHLLDVCYMIVRCLLDRVNGVLLTHRYVYIACRHRLNLSHSVYNVPVMSYIELK